jgi:type II restriction enzyme
MNLEFDTSISKAYNSKSQIIRVLTEHWVKLNLFCPNCGSDDLEQFNNNMPVADFVCIVCNQEFELKSKKGMLGNKIVDGAYKTMIKRIESENNPNFFFLTYNQTNLCVKDFLIIPKHYFVSTCIEQRKPLAETAKRAGWIGCNILLDKVPSLGRIFLIENYIAVNKETVLEKWNKTAFLKDINPSSKGWIIETMKIIESISSQYFKLEDMYQHIPKLQNRYPNNNFIKAKIRQQLQILRDRGLLEFVARGYYKKSV